MLVFHFRLVIFILESSINVTKWGAISISTWGKSITGLYWTELMVCLTVSWCNILIKSHYSLIILDICDLKEVKTKLLSEPNCWLYTWKRTILIKMDAYGKPGQVIVKSTFFIAYLWLEFSHYDCFKDILSSNGYYFVIINNIIYFQIAFYACNWNFCLLAEKDIDMCLRCDKTILIISWIIEEMVYIKKVGV